MGALFPEVRVNGEVIPPSAIAAEAQMHPAPAGKPGLAWRAAARALAVRALLLQEARARGLSPAPRDLGDGRRESPEEALIRGLLDAVVEAEPPDEGEIRAAWERDPARFSTPPLWEASHILVAADPSDIEAFRAAEARARSLAEAARRQPAGFATLARQQSDCGSKANGGALGQLSPGDSVPEFEAALRRLAEGEITAEPVATRHGWHVIRLDGLAPGRPLPYAAARPRVAAALERAAWARAARAFLARLTAGAEIQGVELAAPGAGTP
jgi:peptidyl-prolyl cis-trans isomerase C